MQSQAPQQWQHMPVTNFPVQNAFQSNLKHGSSVESTMFKGGASEYTLYHPPQAHQYFSPHSATLLSKENKMLRFKITDFTAQQPI